MRTRLVGVAVVSLAVAACGGAGLADGTYAGFAASDGTVPDVVITLDGASASFSVGGDTVSAGLGDETATFDVCGPGSDVTGVEVGTSISVGDLAFSRPALFADCGITSPERITLVDLDSETTPAEVPPFSTWLEACNQADPDC